MGDDAQARPSRLAAWAERSCAGTSPSPTVIEFFWLSLASVDDHKEVPKIYTFIWEGLRRVVLHHAHRCAADRDGIAQP